MAIEVIDFTAKNAPQQFAQSLKKIGFAVLSSHPINHDLIDRAYQQWHDFFHSDEKYNYEFNENNHDGFISQTLSETAKGNEIKDLKEFYHYYPWGRCPESLKPTTETLAKDLTAMAKTLLSWVEENTPEQVTSRFSMPLSEMIDGSERTLFRLIHYPPLNGKEPAGAIRAFDHEDINLLTLLPAATAKGLQVKNSQGQWLDVPCDKGWMIVNTGDMLQECSSHYYPSTTHRVINPQGELAKQSRLSMPLFLHPRRGIQLSDQYTTDSYRQERYKELGLANDNTD